MISRKIWGSSRIIKQTVERFRVTSIEFLTQLISRRGLVAAGGYRTKVTIEEFLGGRFS
jgi:hypothetical protein